VSLWGRVGVLLNDKRAVEQFGEIFSRKMLGSILVGKFIGDGLGQFLHTLLGANLGDLVGVIISVAIFTFWHRISKWAKDVEETGEEKIKQATEEA